MRADGAALIFVRTGLIEYPHQELTHGLGAGGLLACDVRLRQGECRDQQQCRDRQRAKWRGDAVASNEFARAIPGTGAACAQWPPTHVAAQVFGQCLGVCIALRRVVHQGRGDDKVEIATQAPRRHRRARSRCARCGARMRLRLRDGDRGGVCIALRVGTHTRQ